LHLVGFISLLNMMHGTTNIKFISHIVKHLKWNYCVFFKRNQNFFRHLFHEETFLKQTTTEAKFIFQLLVVNWVETIRIS